MGWKKIRTGEEDLVNRESVNKRKGKREKVIARYVEEFRGLERYERIL